jgi:hypothetical protein
MTKRVGRREREGRIMGGINPTLIPVTTVRNLSLLHIQYIQYLHF